MKHKKKKKIYISHGNYRDKLPLFLRSYIRAPKRPSVRTYSKKSNTKSYQSSYYSTHIRIYFYDDINSSTEKVSFYSIASFIKYCENHGYYVPIPLEDELYSNSAYYCCLDSSNYSLIGAASYDELLNLYYSYYHS